MKMYSASKEPNLTRWAADSTYIAKSPTGLVGTRRIQPTRRARASTMTRKAVTAVLPTKGRAGWLMTTPRDPCRRGGHRRPRRRVRGRNRQGSLERGSSRALQGHVPSSGTRDALFTHLCGRQFVVASLWSPARDCTPFQGPDSPGDACVLVTLRDNASASEHAALSRTILDGSFSPSIRGNC